MVQRTEWKTGELAPRTGRYAFVRYTTGHALKPAPTREEREIPMQEGNPFPTIKSTKTAAYWRWIGP